MGDLNVWNVYGNKHVTSFFKKWLISGSFHVFFPNTVQASVQLPVISNIVTASEV